jgi:hypothetical protein
MQHQMIDHRPRPPIKIRRRRKNHSFRSRLITS